nr:hypothetical protein [Tanacetum cinerariifolium]
FIRIFGEYSHGLMMKARDEGFDLNDIHNLTATPKLIPTEVTDGMSSATTGPDRIIQVLVSKVSLSPNKSGSEQVGNVHVMSDIPSSYSNKLSHASLTKANLRKLKTKVSNDANYDVWLPLAFVHEEKYGLKRVTTVKGFFCFKFSSIEGVDSVLRDSPYMIPNLEMVVPNIKGTGYAKETIHVEYEWEPPRWSKGQTSRADDEGFIGVKRKKSGGSNRGNKNFKPVYVKPKTHYSPKANHLIGRTSHSSKDDSFLVVRIML